MTATISSMGEEQGFVCVRGITDKLGLSIGDKMKIFVENQKIILEPIGHKRAKYDINDLVAKLPKVAYKDNQAQSLEAYDKPLEFFDDKMGCDK